MRRFAGPLIWTAYVAWPAHLGGLFHGVPIGPLDALALLAIWWLALARGPAEAGPYRKYGVGPPGGARLLGSVLLATIIASSAIPGEPGFRARYFANADAREPFEPSTEYPRRNFTRIDERLDFAPGRAEFPLPFFNDIARFNFYNPGEPARDKLPFAVVWEGNWWIDGDPRAHTLYLDAPRASSELIVDGSTVVPTSADAGPRSVELTLSPGWHRLDVRFASPYAAPRRFSAGELIDSRRAPFEASSVLTRRIKSWQITVRHALNLAKTFVDVCALGWLVWLAGAALRDIRRAFLAGGPPEAQRRRVIAVFGFVAMVEACVFAAPWATRLMLLLGGDDPLTYEFMARGIQLNGVLLRQLEGPYYYQALYPYFLAATHAIFGEGMFGVMLVQRLLVALVAWLLADIAARIGGDDVWPVAFCCSLFFAYGTFAPIVANNLMNEAVFIPLLVAWTAALLQVTRNPTTFRAAGAGLLGGLAALARSTTLIAWVVALLPCWSLWKRTARRGALITALLVPACGVFSLITVRNWIVIHQFVPVPTELPVTLAGGNEPPADLKIDPGRHASWYDRIKLDPLIRQVVEYALTAPGLFARNLWRKALFALGFYEPYATGWGYSPVFIAVWVASVAGFVFALRARAAPAIVVSLPAIIALSQFAAVVLVYPKAERLILPFHTLLLPYAALAVDGALRMRIGIPSISDLVRKMSWVGTGSRDLATQRLRGLAHATPARWLARAGGALLIAALCVYTFVIRTRGISDHFLMLGDQIRDWSIALGPLSRLPLVGTSSTAGNYSFGPVFYWVLWLSRVIIGPFVDNLPHAGGIGLAAVQSCADGILCLGIRKSSGSWAFALAAVLIVASSPFDLALSSVIWNPVLAVALAKTATGLLLFWQDDMTRLRRAALMVVAWFAVQAHTAALPFAGAVFVWVVGSQWRFGVRRLGLAAIEAALVVAVLQLPAAFAVQSIQPTKLQMVLAQPQDLRFLDAFHALAAAVDSTALTPWRVPQLSVALLGAGAVLLFQYGPFAAPVVISTLPVLLAVGMMSTWQEAYDFYWFLTIVPAAVLMIVWVSRVIPSRLARTTAAVILLAAAVFSQARRIESAELVFRMPAYGPLVRGSREIVRAGQPVRRVEAPFLPPLSDPQFVFTILGGQIRPDAPVTARLSESGGVTYDAR